MFQTIGHEVVENQARCLDMPLFRRSLQWVRDSSAH